MQAGIYRHKGAPENYYLFIGLGRHHDTGEEYVIYVPLLTKPEWAGTARMALRTVEDFESTFTWVGDRLPGE